MKRLVAILGITLVTLFCAQTVAVVRAHSTTPHPAPRSSIAAAPLRVVQLPKPVANVNPDRASPRGDLIEVSKREQRLTVWRDGVVIMRLVISTGQPGYETPSGHFRIYGKARNGWSSKWKVVMPWMLPFYGNYTFHQLPHYPGSTSLIGASELGRPASHGCVRVDAGDAVRLYNWTKVGTPVWIH